MAAPLAETGVRACDTRLSARGLFDPACLHTLHSEAMPRLRTYPAPRVWLAECEAAEDLLALRVLLAEHRLDGRSQVYVTSADAQVITQVRSEAIGADRLAACAAAYRESGGRRRLEEQLVFQDGRGFLRNAGDIIWGQHDLAGDTSFNEFDLILCARALTDCSGSLQARMLDVFAASLPPLGMLWVHAEGAGRLPYFKRVIRGSGLYLRRM